jgi:3'(2'), 5'-bisphosphate nucleotidase
LRIKTVSKAIDSQHTVAPRNAMKIMPSATISELVALSLAAGQEIMSIYNTDFTHRDKSDSTPVTEADEKAELIILAGLARAFPNVPVVAEESAAKGNLPSTVGNLFFLVDPLDGTREFLSRNGEFTVNIALIEDGYPKLGVVYAPALGLMFWGEGKVAAWSENGHRPASQLWHACNIRALPPEGATVLASRSHRDAETEAFLQKQKVATIIGAGSSLKFCRIAAAHADLYPRFGRTMEWDTAAGQAVLEAAGGHVVDTAGRRLSYGKHGDAYANPAFIACGPPPSAFSIC